MFERSVMAQEERLAAARAALGEVQARIGTAREGGERASLPLAASVAELLPGGLRRGTVLSVSGSTSLVLALAGEASREGSWVAVVGMPHVGLVAATRRGVDLARLALVPHPGAQAATAAAACIDGMDLVILGPRLALSDADRRRLAARARERGSVLLSVGVAGIAWPGARIEMVVSPRSGAGSARGTGGCEIARWWSRCGSAVAPCVACRCCLMASAGYGGPGCGVLDLPTAPCSRMRSPDAAPHRLS